MTKTKTPTLSCTFCGKSMDEVEKLIAGPAVFICNECVKLCNEIITEEEVPGAVATYELEDSDTADTQKLLELIRRTQSQAAPLDDYLGKLVDKLRMQGATWATIAEALGVTRQAAWSRFGNEE